jgi:hypothetical protein
MAIEAGLRFLERPEKGKNPLPASGNPFLAARDKANRT